MLERAHVAVVQGVGHEGVAAAIARHRLREPALVAIAGRQDHVTGTHAHTVFGAQVDVRVVRFDRGDGGAVVDACAVLLALGKQAVAEAVRVHAGGQAAQDRAIRMHAVVVPERLAFDPFHRQFVRLAGLQLVAQVFYVARAAGVVQAVLAREVGAAEGIAQALQVEDGLRAGAIRQRRGGHAVLLGQFDHRRIDFVLQQGGAGRGAPPADVALFDHYDFMAVAQQFVRDQRGGDATTDDGDLALGVLLQARVGAHQAVADRPERVATFEVHAVSISEQAAVS